MSSPSSSRPVDLEHRDGRQAAGLAQALAVARRAGRRRPCSRSSSLQGDAVAALRRRRRARSRACRPCRWRSSRKSRISSCLEGPPFARHASLGFAGHLRLVVCGQALGPASFFERGFAVCSAAAASCRCGFAPSRLAACSPAFGWLPPWRRGFRLGRLRCARSASCRRPWRRARRSARPPRPA